MKFLKKKFETEYIIFLEFLSKAFSYAQINYDNEKIGDQVHTHKANFFYDKASQLNYFNEENKKNCRKFMHICFDKDKYVNYLIIHNVKLQNQSKKNLKIRFFDEHHTEDVKNLEIQDDKILEIFNLNEMFNEVIAKSNLTRQ